MLGKKTLETQEKKVVLGRLTNNLKMGIVGLPSTGKSIFFNLLAKKKVNMSKNNSAKELSQACVYLPDERLNKLSSIFQPKKTTPTMFTIVDVAGQLTGGSYTSMGLGNGFLAHLKDVDGIFHIVRAFDSEIDEEIDPKESDVDPIRDLQIVSEDMIMKDIEIIDRRVEDLNKKISRTNEKTDKDEKDILQKIKSVLEKKKWIKDEKWTNEEIEVLNDQHFLTAKPIVYLINISTSDFQKKKNKWLAKIQTWIKANIDGPIIPFSALQEREVLEEKKGKMLVKEDEKNLNESPSEPEKKEEAKKEPIEEKINLNEIPQNSMIPKILKAGFKILDLVTYQTVGEDECRAWTIREGWKAPKAASVIHNDLEKGFICAEVMKYDDFIKIESIPKMKEEGKYRQQGKEYVVEDGDIIEFKSNFTGKKTKK